MQLSKSQRTALEVMLKHGILLHHRQFYKFDCMLSWNYKEPIKTQTFISLKRHGLIEAVPHENQDAHNTWYGISQKGKNILNETK